MQRVQQIPKIRIPFNKEFQQNSEGVMSSIAKLLEAIDGSELEELPRTESNSVSEKTKEIYERASR